MTPALVVLLLGAIGYHLNMVGPIENFFMQANLYSHTGSSIKISGWSGAVSGFCTFDGCFKIFLYRKISFVLLNSFYARS